MIKNKLVQLSILLILTITIEGCDAYNLNIVVRQSISNNSSDTIFLTNSKNEFRGYGIKDTIICFPFAETIFYDAKLHKQPLEPYNFPLIPQESIIKTSSGRILIKDIFDENNWQFDTQKKHEWLRFVITEDDLK
jgi:hypothetical protein